MTAQTPADVSALSYEEARDELIQVVARLEQGGIALEESLQLWERGEALAARCEEWLLGARKRLEEARERTQGACDDSGSAAAGADA